jgi:hypothetical protein
MFWLGWGLAIALLQIWHLFLPVDIFAMAACAAAGLAGLCVGSKSLGRLYHHLAKRSLKSVIVSTVVVLAVALYWANLALGPPGNWDTGLYHVQAVRWNSEYPIVVGLGNLHGRLAFNNSSFLYASMLDVGPWAKKSHHLCSGLLSLTLITQLIVGCRGVLRTADRQWLYSLLCLLLLSPLILMCHRPNFSPDTVAFLLGILPSLQLVQFMTRDWENANDRNLLLVSMSFLSIVGITVKVSFAPFGLAIVSIALAEVWARSRREQSWLISRRAVTVVGCLSAITAVTWIVRGVLLSGYVAYPHPLGAVDVPWRIPADRVTYMRDLIVAWARNSAAPVDEVLGNWHWLKPWALQQIRDFDGVVLPFLCAAVGMTSLAYRFFRGSNKLPREFALLLAPSLLTVLFVFLTAPDFRFAGAAPWLLGMTALALSLADYAGENSFGARKRFLASFALVLTLAVFGKSARHLNGTDAVSHMGQLPVVELSPRITWSGLTVYVPVDGNRAWDAPLPNTPHFDPDLTLRHPADLSSGFLINVRHDLVAQ